MQKNNYLIKPLLCLSLLFLPSIALSDDHEREERHEEREHHERDEYDEETQLHEEINEAFNELKELVNNDEQTVKALTEIGKTFQREEPEEYLEHLIHLIELFEEEGVHAFQSELKMMISEFHIQKLVDHYHQTDDESERQKLKEKINKVLTDLLKVRLEQREKEFKHLSGELEHIKKGIDAVKKNPQHFIDKKMQELIGGDFDPFE